MKKESLRALISAEDAFLAINGWKKVPFSDLFTHNILLDDSISPPVRLQKNREQALKITKENIYKELRKEFIKNSLNTDFPYN